MAGYVKDDPACGADIFVGNVKLQPFTEQAGFPQTPAATAELLIDVMASPTLMHVEFTDIALILEINAPAGTQFVEHSARGKFLWGVPSGLSWAEALPGRPTTRLRLRHRSGSLLSGPGNGLSHRVGVYGLPAGAAMNIHAEVTAKQAVIPSVSPTFGSRTFGDPDYAQLRTGCTPLIAAGAADGAEMGAFHTVYQPQREANLRMRLDEYLPIGLEAGLIYVDYTQTSKEQP
jgi:hypothetical protein